MIRQDLIILMCSLDKEKFNEIGIYKIISFTDKYIEKSKRKNKEEYNKIKNLYKIINKEFSFQEYKELLREYFCIDSQWINFLNFINILKFKSVSYNKLGFLILMSQHDLKIYVKNLKIIDFIRHLSEKNNLEDQFWEMLEPNNYFLIINKLDKEYNILRKYNWFNVQKLIRDLKKFNPSIKDNFSEENTKCQFIYEKLYVNFKLGQQYSQYNNFMKSFLYKFININYKENIDKIDTITKSEIFFVNYIFDAIKPKHF